MGFIKRVIAFLAVVLNTVFAYSAQPKIIEPNQFAIIDDKDASCQKSLEQMIKKILDIKTVKISNQAFTKSSHLYLTNHKPIPMVNDPMQGYEGGNKIFLLHIKNGKCFISLVDYKNKPLSSLEVLSCHCIRLHKK